MSLLVDLLNGLLALLMCGFFFAMCATGAFVLGLAVTGRVE